MYSLFKFLHILATMIWIGGVSSLVIINARLARTRNWDAVEALSEQASFYGRAVLGPAAGITLVAGIVTAGLMGVRFGALWILWGFAGILGSMLLGMVFIRKTATDLSRLAAERAPDPAVLAMLQRRMATLNLVNLLLLVSVVAAMVFKPVL